MAKEDLNLRIAKDPGPDGMPRWYSTEKEYARQTPRDKRASRWSKSSLNLMKRTNRRFRARGQQKRR